MPHPIMISGPALGVIAAALLAWVAAAPVAVGASQEPAGQVSADDHSQHQMDHSAHDAEQAGGDDPHAQHRAMMQQTGYQRLEHRYSLADHKLLDMHGQSTTLLEVLGSDRPVMVNFIFTTCTTICPVMSATFAQVQEQLGPDAEALRMISISIDPEHDTPERLRAYAKRFDAGPQWDFYTGDVGDIIAIQKAFDVYRGSKMSHEPTTLMRKSAADPWVRIDGLASAGDIVTEYRQLIRR